MRRYAAVAAAALLAVSVGAAGDPAETAGDDAGQLGRALRSAAESTSYGYVVEEEPGKGTGGPVEGRYQKGRPCYFKADRLEFFQKGDTLIYKQGDRWKRSKTGTESDPLTVLGSVAKVRGVRLPHRELAE